MKKNKEDFFAKAKVRKRIDFFSSILFFCIIFTVFFFIRITLFNIFFILENKENLIFYSKDIFIIGKMFAEDSGKITFLKCTLCIETILVSIIFSVSIYQRLLIRILPVDNKAQVKGDNAVNEGDSAVNNFPYDQRKLQLIVGEEHKKITLDKIVRPKYLIVPEKAMFQNFLITGTIGTGKTASLMYPLTKQALFYEADNPEKKAGFLILDVKGNFYQKVLEFARQAGREDDIVIVSLKDNRYNLVHKPNMESSDLAGRCKKVISLFSNGAANKDSFWDNKAMQMMTECIRLLRITEKDEKSENPPYITLEKIHGIVTNKEYRDKKIKILENVKNKVKDGENVGNEHATLFNIEQAETYFTNEFNSSAETTIETIKACVTEMTSFFVSSEKMQRAFSPKTIEECDFLGFEECINEGKIVVLALNAAEYPEVSKTIAAYMKLDFHSEIMQRTSKESLNKDGGEVVKAINRIEKRYKSRFFSIFKSITSDNGTEFTDTKGLQKALYRKGDRTVIYTCHPYCSFERGSNENVHRFIRRIYAKGVSFKDLTRGKLKKIEEYINNYPRRIFGGKCAKDIYKAEFAKLFENTS